MTSSRPAGAAATQRAAAGLGAVAPADLGPRLLQAFEVAAGELGMCTAAWLFVRELHAVGGAPMLAALRDRLGREFPVVDSVAAAVGRGATAPVVDPAPMVAALAGASRLVIVGLETAYLDALVPLLPDLRIALVTRGELPADWERVIANYGGRVEATDFTRFQAHAGRRSVLCTFGYGIRGEVAYVPASWLRVIGRDTRTQFRSIIAWEVLREPMDVYPRWLVEVSTAGFSHWVR